MPTTRLSQLWRVDRDAPHDPRTVDARRRAARRERQHPRRRRPLYVSHFATCPNASEHRRR